MAGGAGEERSCSCSKLTTVTGLARKVLRCSMHTSMSFRLLTELCLPPVTSHMVAMEEEDEEESEEEEREEEEEEEEEEESNASSEREEEGWKSSADGEEGDESELVG